MNNANNIEGSSIVLVFTKYLIELMGGTIGIESTSDKDSIFWVELTLFKFT